MAKAIAKWTGGRLARVEAALRSDGVLFKRYQERSAYGYRWGKWKESGRLDLAAIPGTLGAGFATLYPPDQYTDFNPRLPD